MIDLDFLAPLTAVLVACHAGAQSPILYNAALNTLPAAQCFAQFSPPASLQLVGGELRVGPTFNVNYFARTDFPIDFNAGFECEASFRVVSAGCGPGPGVPLRYAIQLSAVGDSGHFYAAHFCSTHVALVNTPNLPIDGVNVVSMPYPVAGATIVARVVAGPNQATLFVNGVALLSVPRGTYTYPTHEFYFGDGTYAGSADAEYFVSYVRANSTGPGCAPTSVVTTPSGCAGLGALSYSGSVQAGLPATATFSVPGSGGIPVMFVGSYAMQPPYCSAGCRFGLDPLSAIFVVTNSVTVNFPAMSPFVGWPITFQGARIGLPSACSFPLDHTLTDPSVMTL